MTARELAVEGLSLASRIICEATEAHTPVEGDLPKERIKAGFVRRHLQYVATLGEEVFPPYGDYTRASSRLAIRAMVESSFQIGAACADPNYAVEKMILEYRSDEAKLRASHERKTNPNALKTAQIFADQAADYEKRFGLTPKKDRGTVAYAAKLAQLEGMYKTGYSYLSLNTHGTTTGILAHENGAALGAVYGTGLHALACSCRGAVEVLVLLNPDELRDRADAFIQSHLAVTSSGGFAEPFHL